MKYTDSNSDQAEKRAFITMPQAFLPNPDDTELPKQTLEFPRGVSTRS